MISTGGVIATQNKLLVSLRIKNKQWKEIKSGKQECLIFNINNNNFGQDSSATLTSDKATTRIAVQESSEHEVQRYVTKNNVIAGKPCTKRLNLPSKHCCGKALRAPYIVNNRR